MFLEKWKERRKERKVEQIMFILNGWNNIAHRKHSAETLRFWAYSLSRHRVKKIENAIFRSVQYWGVAELNFPSMLIYLR